MVRIRRSADISRHPPAQPRPPSASHPRAGFIDSPGHAGLTTPSLAALACRPATRAGVEARDVFGGVLRRGFTTGSSTTAPAGVDDHTPPSPGVTSSPAGAAASADPPPAST